MNNRVIDLVPGDEILVGPRSSAVFVQRAEHPLYPGLALVIWRRSNGAWSHDALSYMQDVGEVVPSTPDERNERLCWALYRP